MMLLPSGGIILRLYYKKRLQRTLCNYIDYNSQIPNVFQNIRRKKGIKEILPNVWPSYINSNEAPQEYNLKSIIIQNEALHGPEHINAAILKTNIDRRRIPLSGKIFRRISIIYHVMSTYITRQYFHLNP